MAHFQTLSGQEQTQQRETWSQELKILEKEIAELKMQLSTHINRYEILKSLKEFLKNHVLEKRIEQV